MTMYKKYCQLGIDGRWIGLEKSDMCVDYFCTPIDATVIGWENSIHYCFIRGYRDMVFAVNPETCVESYVYPLAMNFKDFLRLVLACGSTTAVEQIIGWDGEGISVGGFRRSGVFCRGEGEVDYRQCRWFGCGNRG